MMNSNAVPNSVSDGADDMDCGSDEDLQVNFPLLEPQGNVAMVANAFLSFPTLNAQMDLYQANENI